MILVLIIFVGTISIVFLINTIEELYGEINERDILIDVLSTFEDHSEEYNEELQKQIDAYTASIEEKESILETPFIP